VGGVREEKPVSEPKENQESAPSTEKADTNATHASGRGRGRGRKREGSANVTIDHSADNAKRSKTEEQLQKAQPHRRGRKPAAKTQEHANEGETHDDQQPAEDQNIPKEEGQHKTGHDQYTKAEMEEAKKNILEKGRIFFFYRPRVDHDEVHSQKDVQRLYLELCPDNKEKHKVRLLVLGRKKLPNPTSHRKEVFWAFVDHVADRQDEITAVLESITYDTKTLGERTIPASRCIGEGVYEIVMHHDRAHLAYVLTVPSVVGEVQEEFNIMKEASFILQVKNPEYSKIDEGVPGLSSDMQAHYDKSLQQDFDSKLSEDSQIKFASPPDMPRFLDVKNTQLLLVGA